MLRENGPEFVYNKSIASFKTHLTALCKGKQIMMAFDCYGGNFTADLMNCMPPKATIFCYGNLQTEKMGNINHFALIGKD